MSRNTFNTENVSATAKAFHNASGEFNDSVAKLTSIINSYLAENVNEASASVEQEWQNAQTNLQKVKEYFEQFGKGLDTQANTLTETIANLSSQWKG